MTTTERWFTIGVLVFIALWLHLTLCE